MGNTEIQNDIVRIEKKIDEISSKSTGFGIYPQASKGTDVASGSNQAYSTSWVEIIPVSTITDDVKIERAHLSCEDAANVNFINVKFALGGAGNEVEAAERAIRMVSIDTSGRPWDGYVYFEGGIEVPANTRVSAKSLNVGNNQVATIKVVLEYKTV